MSVVLSEAMQQAETAIDGGDYQSAIETCRRIVSQYPGFGSAYQLLGQAYLKQGQPGEAEHAFSRALSSNPRQAPAYLGLGLVAEERGVVENALAYCQVAWELEPQTGRYRDPVVRLAGKQYGADGQLQLTRAALAQLHVNSSRFRRAVNEYQAALSELPDRVDLWMGLAETLWQLGEDADAAEISREFLLEYPDLVQALVILADIEHRHGNSQTANELRERLRRADPTGLIVAAMLAATSRHEHEYLRVPAGEIPVLDEQADVVVAERPHIAPAPDFSYQPETGVEESDTDSAGLEHAAPAAAEAASDVDELSSEFEGLQPMEPEEFGLDKSEVSSDAGQWDAGDPEFDSMFAQVGEDQATANQAAADQDLSGLASALDAATDETGQIDADASESMSAGEPGHSAEAQPDELVDLAQSLEESVAGAVDRAMDSSPGPAGTDSGGATPPSGTGYTTLLGELGQEGLRPFDPASSGVPGSAQRAGGEDSGGTEDYANLTEGWDDVDLESATPPTTGRTDELRMLDDLGVTPFNFEEDADTDKLTAFSPFGGMAPSSAAPGTDDAEAPERPDQPEASASAEDTFEGLEPFSFEEFDDPSGDDQIFSFDEISWSESESESMLPSDADLDAMLGSSEIETPEPATQAESRTADISADTGAPELEDTPADHGEADSAEYESTAPSPEWYAFNDPMAELDASTAVTRQLGDEEESPSDPAFEQQLAEAEAAAADNLQQMQESAEVVEPQHEEAVVEEDAGEAPAASTPSTDFFPRTEADSLVSDEQLFERSRVAKNGMIAEGIIRGDLELLGEQSTEWPSMTSETPEPEVPQPTQEATPDFEVSTGATRDVDTLRASLQADPDDDELHWWLAQALYERGDVQDAFTEFRWLIRHAPARHDEIIRVLDQSVEHHRETEMAHRLLADIYRRRGDSSRSSRHASMAMAERRRNR